MPEMFQSYTLLWFVPAVLGLAFLSFVLFYTRLNALREQRRDEVMMSLFREGIERQLYALNDRLTVNGARFEDANHLALEANQYANRGDTKFLNRLGIVESEIETEKDLAFVLTPFNQDFEDRYQAIYSAVRSQSLRCERGDEHQLRGNILSYIVRRILEARVVIALLDGRSPNVFYELGIAHALGKYVILIAKSPRNIPVDLKGHQVVFYNDLGGLRDNLVENIKMYLIGNEVAD